jgi:hypothetical protein
MNALSDEFAFEFREDGAKPQHGAACRRVAVDALLEQEQPDGWRQLDLPVVVVGRDGLSGADDN